MYGAEAFAMSSRRVRGSFSSCITRSIYSRGDSPDASTALLISVVILFNVPLTRPLVLRPRAICHLSNRVYFRHALTGAGLNAGGQCSWKIGLRPGSRQHIF